MVDILLIAPPFKYGTLEVTSPVCPHLGIAFIASVLEQKNYSVEFLDAFALKLAGDGIKEKIKLVSPKVVGVTAVTAEFPVAFDICKMTKEVDPDITTVLGGAHATVMPESANSEYIDYIVIGEGEDTIIELMDYIFAQKSKISGMQQSKALCTRNAKHFSVPETEGFQHKRKGTKSKIKGIGYKEGGKLRLTEPRPLIKNLDELPLPAYHLLPMDRYRPYGYYDVGRNFTTMITSRGCPFKCIYCSSSAVFGHRWRAMSPEKVLEGIKMLNDNYGVSHIYFQDDEFTINHQRTEKICELIIDNKLDIVWECLSRVDHVDDKLISKMAKAGCRGIWYGTECGYQEGLKRIKKGTTLEQTKNAIKITKKHGIQARASFMIGFPWESEKEIKQTIRFAKGLDADFTAFQVLIPYPGTEIYEEMKQKNLIIRNDWHQYIQQPIIGTLPMIRTEHLTNEQLKKLDNLAYFSMYANPLYILKRLSKIENLTQLKRIFLSGIEVMKNTLKFD